MDVQVQVAGQITSKPTSNGGTKFDIPLSNGMKASTFDAALATKVSQFGAQVFTARIEQKPNPRGGNPFTNLMEAAGPGEQLFPEVPQAGTAIQPTTALSFAPGTAGGITPTAIVPAESGGRGFSEADKIRITKLAVLGTAYGFVGHHLAAGAVEFEDAVKWADSLALKLYTDARSHEQGVQTQQAAPVAAVAAEPQAVAAFVAQEAGTEAVQVGAEGIAPAAEAAVLPWSTN
jgi:hypothetical protein